MIQRVTIMQFAESWPEDSRLPEMIYTKMNDAYIQIETNPVLLKMIGYSLAIGNILNGGGPKGQSDGYEWQVLGKIAGTKDNTNQTMMQYILKKMYKDDFPDELHSQCDKLLKCVSIKENDLEILDTKVTEANASYMKHREMLDAIENDSQGPEDLFIN